MTKSSLHRGYTLLETVVYVGLMSAVLLFVLATLIGMTRAYGRSRASVDTVSVGSMALERIIREARGAVSIDLAGSTLDASPGVLLLNTTTASGTASTVKFYVSAGSLLVDEGGVTRGSLTKPTVSATKIVFRRFATTTSEGIKVELMVESRQIAASTSANFYGSAVLRGSYE